MNSRFAALSAAPTSPTHELLFVSLYQPGRGIAVPCDAAGHVDLNTLSGRLRNAYLGARALVGREYAFPMVHRLH
jgi:hypothetical protein